MLAGTINCESTWLGLTPVDCLAMCLSIINQSIIVLYACMYALLSKVLLKSIEIHSQFS